MQIRPKLGNFSKYSKKVVRQNKIFAAEQLKTAEFSQFDRNKNKVSYPVAKYQSSMI